MSDIRIQKTGEPDIVEASDGRLTLSVPIQIKRRSGRKLVTLPNGETAPVRPWDVAPTSIQLALARGYRWLASTFRPALVAHSSEPTSTSCWQLPSASTLTPRLALTPCSRNFARTTGGWSRKVRSSSGVASSLGINLTS